MEKGISVILPEAQRNAGRVADKARNCSADCKRQFNGPGSTLIHWVEHMWKCSGNGQVNGVLPAFAA